jgi:hypothetical protein
MRARAGFMSLTDFQEKQVRPRHGSVNKGGTDMPSVCLKMTASILPYEKYYSALQGYKLCDADFIDVYSHSDICLATYPKSNSEHYLDQYDCLYRYGRCIRLCYFFGQ